MKNYHVTTNNQVFDVDYENKSIKTIKKAYDHIDGVVVLTEDTKISWDTPEGETKEIEGKAGQILVVVYTSDKYPNHCFVIESEELKENIKLEKEFYDKLKEKQCNGDDCEACGNCPECA